jgi:PAS domain-containing protein
MVDVREHPRLLRRVRQEPRLDEHLRTVADNATVAVIAAKVRGVVVRVVRRMTREFQVLRRDQVGEPLVDRVVGIAEREPRRRLGR